MATTTAAKPSRQIRRLVSIGPGGAWAAATPPSVCRSYEVDPQQGWATWREHLGTRRFLPLAKLLPGKGSPLAWALPPGDRGQSLALVKLLRRLDGLPRRRSPKFEDTAARWLAAGEANGLAGSAATPIDVAADENSLGLECLAWCAALPQLAAQLSAPLWWRLLNRLTAIAGRDPRQLNGPLATQLLSAELPLLLAYCFPEVENCRALAEAGRRALSAGIDELLDGEGLPHAKHLDLLRPLLASWTRMRAVGQAMGEACCDQSAAEQYSSFVRHALRLSRANGLPVFAWEGSRPWNHDLLKFAARHVGDREAQRMFRLAKNGVARSTAVRGKQLPCPAFESEWAAIAHLRCDWTRTSPRLTVAYGGRKVAVELSAGERCLCSGDWSLDVRFNGRPLAIQGDWGQSCWVSDEDVDYLELSARLSDEVTVERHVLVGRRDRFLLLADAVLGIQQGRIEYRGTLPLTGFSSFHGAAQTRDGSLVAGRRPRAAVLPLALGEWRCGPSPGSLQATQRGLELAQTADGQSLFAPLFIDLQASRIGRDSTWRQLTVAQSREIVASDTAAGYRAQVGRSQWLVYRSLAAPEIRSVLGTNLMHEFLVGKLAADGRVQRLLEIESI